MHQINWRGTSRIQQWQIKELHVHACSQGLAEQKNKPKKLFPLDVGTGAMLQMTRA